MADDDDRRAWNSTLRPGKGLGRSKKALDRSKGGLSRSTKPMKRRSLKERFKDRPECYGPIFLLVRQEPCFAARVLPTLHACGLGYAPASAHHLGDTDLDGLLPACGRMHDVLENPRGVRMTEAQLQAAGQPSLREIGLQYVGRAIVELRDTDQMPSNLEELLKCPKE